MRNLVGVGLIILGGVLAAVTGIQPFSILLFIGVFLFASFPDEAIFYDYRMANSEDVLLRKRYYMNFLPFTLASSILTLGIVTLNVQIPWKEEYFKAPIHIEAKEDLTKLSRKEYVALRNEQRIIYSTQVLSKEFMASSYTQADIGFKRKKTRLLIVSILAALMLTMLTQPGAIYLTLIYEAVFVPAIILWFPEYKDAKILHEAYNRALNGSETVTKTSE